jgi:hypothetical protein
LLAIAALLASIANTRVVSEPGAVIGSLKAKSINNIFGLFLPLTSQGMFDNKTFHLN